MDFPVEVAVVDKDLLLELLYEDLLNCQQIRDASLSLSIGLKQKIAELEGHPELWAKVEA